MGTSNMNYLLIFLQQKEYDWLLKEEVHNVLEELQVILAVGVQLMCFICEHTQIDAHTCTTMPHYGYYAFYYIIFWEQK